jgi:hypothetical protein
MCSIDEKNTGKRYWTIYCPLCHFYLQGLPEEDPRVKDYLSDGMMNWYSAAITYCAIEGQCVFINDSGDRRLWPPPAADDGAIQTSS